MTIQRQRMTCACGRVFEAELVMDAPTAVVIASMKAVRCPACGGRKIYLGGSYDDAPPLTAPIIERSSWWRQRGETGTSSLTIHQAFLGKVYAQARWPHDADDYRRARPPGEKVVLSFAYGNVAMSNPSITMDDVRKAAAELKTQAPLRTHFTDDGQIVTVRDRAED